MNDSLFDFTGVVLRAVVFCAAVAVAVGLAVALKYGGHSQNDQTGERSSVEQYTAIYDEDIADRDDIGNNISVYDSLKNEQDILTGADVYAEIMGGAKGIVYKVSGYPQVTDDDLEKIALKDKDTIQNIRNYVGLEKEYTKTIRYDNQGNITEIDYTIA